MASELLISSSFILGWYIPLSFKTWINPVATPTLKTILQTFPSLIVSLMRGYFPPGFAYMHLERRQSMLHGNLNDRIPTPLCILFDVDTYTWQGQCSISNIHSDVQYPSLFSPYSMDALAYRFSEGNFTCPAENSESDSCRNPSCSEIKSLYLPLYFLVQACGHPW